MQTGNGERGIRTVLSDAIRQVRVLLTKEAQLAHAEMSETASKATIGIGLAAAGVILLLPAFFILCMAAVAGLDAYGFAPYWSGLIVFAVIFVLSLVLIAFGMSALKSVGIMPRRAIRQLRQDAIAAKAHLRSSAQ